VTFGLGKCVLGPSKGSEQAGSLGNTNPSATTLRAGSTGLCPIFLSTDLPRALGTPRDKEVVNVPSEEELVDDSSEDELADVPSEDKLANVPAEEELELVDKTLAPDL